ncbi:spore germination protein GerW family protein [Paraclostridium bifermentans]|nr:spore germination protein GerW family protein [Paraclostridium bifermentans]
MKKEVQNTDDSNFAGGSAGAISLQPVAFVVVENGETRLMSLDHNINMVDNILSVTPKILEKIQKQKTMIVKTRIKKNVKIKNKSYRKRLIHFYSFYF